MTYLSRIRLNPLRVKGQQFLRNPRTLHAAVMGGFPDPLGNGRVLWRLDTHDRRVDLLVLSPTRPDWTHIIEQAGWPDADGDHVLIRDYAPALGHLAAGREFAFRLTANPIQATMNPDKRTKAQQQRHGDARPQRGFRVAHRTTAHQLDWLLRRTGKWGFSIPDSRTDTAAPGMTPAPDTPTPHEVRIVNTTRYSIRKKEDETRSATVTMQAITFEGRLSVTDPDRLRTAMLTGIGPNKAYGCGLLTLAPLHGGARA